MNPYVQEEIEEVFVKESEDVKVKEWRKLFFSQVLGKTIAEEDIDLLVKSSASPHDAVKLIRADCPPRLVVRILA